MHFITFLQIPGPFEKDWTEPGEALWLPDECLRAALSDLSAPDCVCAMVRSRQGRTWCRGRPLLSDTEVGGLAAVITTGSWSLDVLGVAALRGSTLALLYLRAYSRSDAKA